MEAKKYYYIYKITCLCGNYNKGKYYIGQHQTNNLDDGYAGSGRKISDYYKKYGKEEGKTYIKEILCFCNSWEEMQIMEESYIGLLYNTDENCLNYKSGGNQPKMSDELYKKYKELFESSEYRNKISEGLQKHYNEHPEYFDKLSKASKKTWKREEYRKLISKILSDSAFRQWANEEMANKMKAGMHLAWEDENLRKRASDAAFKRYENEEEHIKTSIAVKEALSSEDVRNKIRIGVIESCKREDVKEKRKKAQENRIWINNGIKNKKIKKDDLDKYLSLGWIIGVNEDIKNIHHIKNNNGKVWVNNGIEGKIINKDELNTYINSGYYIGRLKTNKPSKRIGSKFINNGIICKQVSIEKINYYINNGWKIGMLKK